MSPLISFFNTNPIVSINHTHTLSLILTHLVLLFSFSMLYLIPIVSILLHTSPYSSTLISFILCLGTGMCSVSSLLHLRSSLCHMCHIPSLCLNLCLLLVLLLGMCPVFCVMCTFSYLILLSN